MGAWGRTLGGVEYLNFMVRHLTRVSHPRPALQCSPGGFLRNGGHVIKRLLAYGLEAVPFGTHQPAYVAHTCSPTPSLPELSCAASRLTDCDSYREAFRHSAVASS